MSELGYGSASQASDVSLKREGARADRQLAAVWGGTTVTGSQRFITESTHAHGEREI